MLIKKFDTDANRRAIQEFLNTQGEALSVDGKFGPLTTAAIKRFQAKHNLTADGIVGSDTVSVAMQWGFAGFDTETPTPAPIVKNKTLLVSAGHTNVPGRDQGVAANGLIEGVEAVKIRDRVAELLRGKGFSVREDGGDGVSDPVSKALSLIPGTALAVEIHLNAAAATSAKGVEVLSVKDATRVRRSQVIAAAIAEALNTSLRGDKGWRSDTSGQHSRLAFCRRGGLVIELFFATNPAEAATYKAGFERVCVALADAITEAVSK